MKPYYLLIALSAILFTSCQKELNYDVTTGGTTNAGNYQPTTKDSYWKYQDSSLTGEITTLLATGTTKTINAKSYDVFSTSTSGQPATESYFNRSGNQYSVLGFVGGTVNLEFIYLNDKEAVGYTWSYNAGTVNGFAAKINGKILGKGISKTVNAVNYTDVIHTQLDLQYDLGAGFQSVGIYDFFIAKGVGIIRVESNLSLFGASIITVSNLIDYSIK